MRSFIITCFLFLLTAFHHYYGSLVYHTPWREHVVFGGGIVLLLCWLFLEGYLRYKRKGFLTVYLWLNGLVFGIGIGIFEGFYNHMLKNILFYAGLNRHAWRILYPAPTYEIPDNLTFELSGILQFFVGLLLISELMRYRKRMAF
jgi:hypothetical protein